MRWVLFVAFFIPFILYGQNGNDSTAVKHDVYCFTTDEFFHKDAVTIDTTIDDFQNYNPSYDSLYLVPLWLGNVGQPSISSYTADFFPSFLFKKAFANYLDNTADVLFYDTKSFFTNLFYFTNGSKENNYQSINFLHTQNISRNTNFSVNYNLYASDGSYMNQKSKFANFVTTFIHSGEKYKFAAYIRNRQFKDFYNGGIKSYDYFNTNFATINFPVNLTKASMKNRITEVEFRHKINLGKRFFIAMENKFENDKYSYSDVPSSFYDFSADTVQTNDSAISVALNNMASLGLEFEKVAILVGGGYNFMKHIYSGSFYENFDVPLQARLSANLNKIDLSAGVLSYVSGYHSGSSIIDGDMNLKISRKFSLNSSAKLYSYKPDFYYNYLRFNNVRYYNDFENVTGSDFKVSLGTKRNYLFAGENMASGAVLYDFTGIPYQENKLLSRFYYGVRTAGKIWHIGWSGAFVFTNGSDRISLPSYNARMSLFYHGWLVKNVLQMQAGMQVFAYDKFVAPGFFPASSVFYYNYQAVDNNLSVGMFFNFKLKRARFFFVINNIISSGDLSPTTVYPYPHSGKTFRFGISWTFYDEK